jgi:integrase
MAHLPARLRPFVTVALHTGMRRGELRALKWEHVDFVTGTIHIPQDKAGDGRWVTMNSVGREALLSVKRDQKILSPYVFCSPTGRFMWNWERTWRPAVKAADLPNLRFHDCRHTFPPGSRWRAWISTAGGWKTQVMVQRYSHLSPDHIKAAVERLARVNSGSATGTKTGTESQVG